MTAKKIPFLFVAMLLAVPMLISADVLVPLGPSTEQLLARDAFIKSQTEGTFVACATYVSKTAVSVGEAFDFSWGSYGSDGLGWSPTGSYSIVLQRPGKYEYKLTFNGVGGASTTCKTYVVAL